MAGDFDFKLREELRKMSELRVLRNDYFGSAIVRSQKGKVVTMDMVLDMIVYSSKGDKDLAVRGLRRSKEFVERCRIFLDDHEDEILDFDSRHQTYQLLIEIWTLCFQAAKMVLDWKWDGALYQVPHRVLEGILNEMDHLVLMPSPATAKEVWIRDSIRLFKERNLLFNNTMKMLIPIPCNNQDQI